MLQWFNKKLHNRKGFTLIELVVVIAILGILAAIAVPKFANTTSSANTAANEANIRTIESAASMYVAQYGVEAADIQKLVDAGYLKEVPKNPLTGKKPGYTYSGGVVAEVK